LKGERNGKQEEERDFNGDFDSENNFRRIFLRRPIETNRNKLKKLNKLYANPFNPLSK
jgi:hypothetical protein